MAGHTVSMLGRIYAHVLRQVDPPPWARPRLLHFQAVVPRLFPVGELPRLPATTVDVAHELKTVSTKPAPVTVF